MLRQYLARSQTGVVTLFLVEAKIGKCRDGDVPILLSVIIQDIRGMTYCPLLLINSGTFHALNAW